VAGQRQAPGFNYGGKESEHSGRSRSDNMALAMGVEQELLDKIASEAKEKKGKDIFTEGIESSVWSTSAGLTELADMFIGKPLQSLGWEDNFISEWNEYYQDRAEEKHQDLMDAAARTGKGKTAETAALLVEILGEAGIDALLGMVTGGASAAAKLGSKGGKVLKYADDVFDNRNIGKTLKAGSWKDKRNKLDNITKRDIMETESGFTCFPDDIQNEYAKKIKPEEYINTNGVVENYFDVAMHGNGRAVGFWSKETNMSPQFLADIISHNKKYKDGQRIRLLSCNTGEKIDGEYCFAEELANILGTHVLAPNKGIYMYPNGKFNIGRYNDGKMILYRPNDRGRFR